MRLTLFGQCNRFPSERAAYRYARRLLAGGLAHPACTDPIQSSGAPPDALLLAIGVWLAPELGGDDGDYQVVDTSGVLTRNVKRRHLGWLLAHTAIGFCTPVGWYHGFRVLVAITEQGVITGFGVGEAPRRDPQLAETFFAARCRSRD